MRVEIKPDLIQWACKRVGKNIDFLSQKQPLRKLSGWISGETKPTLKQLEYFAKVTHTPLGYFFSPKPPKEFVPIPDLRTIRNKHIENPSPNLLETLYICQQRQEWYKEFARSIGERPLPFVGSASLQNDVVEVAQDISKTLGFNVEERSKMSNWIEALRHFILQADSIGIMVMISGIVGSNTHRSLNPDEFRGFALSDQLAPLVFINGKDTKAAQMFTLAHELAHIWLGETALSDIGHISKSSLHKIELWCNSVAAELLVPSDYFNKAYRGNISLREELDYLAKYFKVSTLVILRRLYDTGKLSYDEFWAEHNAELERLIPLKKSSGGNFYLTLPVRVSKRFARALISNTLEGQTLHRDAFRLLGFSKLSAFNELGRQLGVLF